MTSAAALETESITAVLLPDRGTNGGFSLVVDGVTQSHVNPDDPLDLQLDYVRRIADVIESALEPGSPVDALHLGAGALTVPRYLQATRPGSRQCVVELHGPLLDFVLAELPLADPDSVELVVGDARAETERRAGDARWRLAVVDVFSGSRAPWHVSTTEFYTMLRSALADDGVVVVNTFAANGLGLSADTAATLDGLFPHLVAVAPAEVVAGERVGNVVIAASLAPIDVEALAARTAAGERAAAVLEGESLRAFAARGAIRVDEPPEDA